MGVREHRGELEPLFKYFLTSSDEHFDFSKIQLTRQLQSLLSENYLLLADLNSPYFLGITEEFNLRQALYEKAVKSGNEAGLIRIGGMNKKIGIKKRREEGEEEGEGGGGGKEGEEEEGRKELGRREEGGRKEGVGKEEEGGREEEERREEGGRREGRRKEEGRREDEKVWKASKNYQSAYRRIKTLQNTSEYLYYTVESCDMRKEKSYAEALEACRSLLNFGNLDEYLAENLLEFLVLGRRRGEDVTKELGLLEKRAIGRIKELVQIEMNSAPLLQSCQLLFRLLLLPPPPSLLLTPPTSLLPPLSLSYPSSSSYHPSSFSPPPSSFPLPLPSSSFHFPPSSLHRPSSSSLLHPSSLNPASTIPPPPLLPFRIVHINLEFW